MFLNTLKLLTKELKIQGECTSPRVRFELELIDKAVR